MRLNKKGYRKVSATVRECTVSELKLDIIEMFSLKYIKDAIVVEITSGDRQVLKSIDDVLNCEWADNCKIELIQKPHFYGTEENNTLVYVIQIAESIRDKVIYE